MKSALSFILLTACFALASCTLTPEQKARIDRAAATGDKLLALGVKYKVISPEEAEAAHDVGAIAVSTADAAPEPAPAKIETTSGK